MQPGAAGAATTSSVAWGKSYSHKSYTYHQVRNKPGPLALHSPDGLNDFVVNANGDLSTSRLFHTGYKGDWWYPYWRAHTDGKGVYFALQSDGRLTVRKGDNRTVVWSSGKSVTAGRYNFALVLSDSGTLTEYSSTGSPFGSGRKVLWQMGRVVGAKHGCGGGLIDSGTTSYDVLVQNGAFSVSVHNVNVLGLMVSVYRWWGGHQDNRKAALVGPGATHDFGVQWYGEDNLPETVTMRVDTSASSVNAALIVNGWCWYNA